MYDVRHKKDPGRYVVAVRGTNPVALSDWLLGDLNVAKLVAWPFANDGAALSTSTAFGLCTLLQLQSAPLGGVGRLVDAACGDVTEVVKAAAGTLETVIRAVTGHPNRTLGMALEPFAAALTEIFSDLVSAEDLPRKVAKRLSRVSRIKPAQLRPRARAAAARLGGTTLFEFLSAQTAQSPKPLDVTVTGPSKGGALAPALASPAPERQAGTKRARRRSDR
jgi:hypothetical protein